MAAAVIDKTIDIIQRILVALLYIHREWILTAGVPPCKRQKYKSQANSFQWNLKINSDPEVLSTLNHEGFSNNGKILPMFRKFAKFSLKLVGYSLSSGLLILIIARLITAFHARSRTTSVEDSVPAPAAVVFGAGLWRDGSPTPVLKDRIKTASDLYFAGKVKKILMSGDNRFVDYNEPKAMQTYALSLGVPDEDIVLDYAGRRTYDTCYRAKEIFGLRDVILVTQGFHLPRALFTCNQLGLAANGVQADQREYDPRSLTYWNMRESFATLIALWETQISHPLPVLGEKEPIFTP
jgi:SanA protein